VRSSHCVGQYHVGGTSQQIFMCEGRVGLCCVYVVFLLTYPYDFINRVQ